MVVAVKDFRETHGGDLVLGSFHLRRVTHRVRTPEDVPIVALKLSEVQLRG